MARDLSAVLEIINEPPNRSMADVLKAMDSPAPKKLSKIDILKQGLSISRQLAAAGQQDPDRSVLGEAGAGLIRGVIGTVETGGGLSRLAATIGRKLTGDNIITTFLALNKPFNDTIFQGMKTNDR